MSTGTDKVTRLSAALVSDAAREGAREQRSARQQLEHWARLGRSVSQRTTASRRRVEAALAGGLPGESLTPEETVVYDAEIDAQLEARLADDDHVVRRASEGFSSVVVDDAGRLVEYRPDGTSVVLGQ
ncbi:hypothetical protein IA539_21000 [Gordonia sp. zg691]|uniref:ParD-like antitoxin of type II toxin-antitoxin system n=1 Tax=Gordonia jinghuaiqii TaxID=2758710 RepID=A0A7D7QZH7_9ACTN|nr:hypothetical protein [Gordonia jinghuaiqii]MBD0863656.1 hypothetical protein [Gordonia jinghuaiqii]MCR5979390.1 hypothetical protein [Gordonia jinghuaiqii]QMT01171.1 hypothetical protein H1R19_20325 [Gordonia jinghuaiqii]